MGKNIAVRLGKNIAVTRKAVEKDSLMEFHPALQPFPTEFLLCWNRYLKKAPFSLEQMLVWAKWFLFALCRF